MLYDSPALSAGAWNDIIWEYLDLAKELGRTFVEPWCVHPSCGACFITAYLVLYVSPTLLTYCCPCRLCGLCCCYCSVRNGCLEPCRCGHIGDVPDIHAGECLSVFIMPRQPTVSGRWTETYVTPSMSVVFFFFHVNTCISLLHALQATWMSTLLTARTLWTCRTLSSCASRTRRGCMTRRVAASWSPFGFLVSFSCGFGAIKTWSPRRGCPSIITPSRSFFRPPNLPTRIAAGGAHLSTISLSRHPQPQGQLAAHRALQRLVRERGEEGHHSQAGQRLRRGTQAVDHAVRLLLRAALARVLPPARCVTIQM